MCAHSPRTPTHKPTRARVRACVQGIVESGRMTRAQYDVCAAAALALFAEGQAVAASRGMILVPPSESQSVVAACTEQRTCVSAGRWRTDGIRIATYRL